MGLEAFKTLGGEILYRHFLQLFKKGYTDGDLKNRYIRYSSGIFTNKLSEKEEIEVKIILYLGGQDNDLSMQDRAMKLFQVEWYGQNTCEEIYNIKVPYKEIDVQVASLREKIFESVANVACFF